MSILDTVFNTCSFLNSVVNHPLNSQRKLQSVGRWIQWHIGSRLVPGPVAVQFINDTQLLVSPGMRGATGNIYTGLYDFENMSFLLHLLNKDDVFIDVGANVGVYTVLASGVCGAASISIEPLPKTFFHLIKNVSLNELKNLVEAHNVGVSNEDGVLNFTLNHDCGNHVILAEDDAIEMEAIEVKVTTLDNIVSNRRPILIKVDVEGFEANVIAGGDHTLSQDSLLAVIMELNSLSSRYGNDDLETHKMMLSYGFSTFNYCPFNRFLEPLS